MKVVIINCFDNHEDRVDLVHEFFKEKGFDVTVIHSDFRHIKKVHRKDLKDGFIFIKSKAYTKNISVARLYSHYKFAKDAFKAVEEIKPDLLYTLVPPNSLAKFAAKYKQKHIDVKLIFDLIDLWPESIPIGKIKKLPPFTFWKRMRDKSLKFADLVITECNLYRTVLAGALKGIKTETVYYAKKEIHVKSNSQLSVEEIHLAYLGSINNIVDISKIKEIIIAINVVKPVILHIIGDGESKQELIDAAESAGASVKYYGKIYDPQKKQDVFDKCHFGLNIMKDSVSVGLTMKSIDYFQHGLPIKNNIQADTEEIIEKYGIGVNINNKNTNTIRIEIIKKINVDFIEIKNKTKEIFYLFFTENKFKKSLQCGLYLLDK